MAVRQESPGSLPPGVLHDFRGPQAPSAFEDFDDLDDFEDAEEEQSPVSAMELQTAFDDCEVALRKFFNNDVTGALNIMKPWRRTSLYHSLGMSIFEFIPAILTFDQKQIAAALDAIKICISICNQHRRNYSLIESIGTMIKKPNYSSYSDLEAHAELCYAEALLLQAAMTIMESEDLTGLIRATLKVKNCYNCYKECAKILEKKQWETETSKLNFQSGVRLGLATFNVMISLLPPKIISLLEFVGFTGNKNLGLSELAEGAKSPGLRSVLCELTLLAYNLVICHFTGAEGDLDTCERILTKQLQVYPSGVWFLLFQGRLELMRGRHTPALTTYGRALHSNNEWKQFRHFCYWEMMWVNSLQMSWREAAGFASRLIAESSWSRTVYSYTRAALLLQLGDEATPEEQQEIKHLMRSAASYKQRIAGKSLPVEKFMIRRSARYAAQGGRLLLPAVELLCLWNMFTVLAGNHHAAQLMHTMIESARERLEGSPQEWEGAYEADNRALLRYLHGCCLAAMGLPSMAIDTLQPILQLKNEIKEDTFLVPYAISEMAVCHHRLGDSERAINLLQEARKKYSGYALESRLHFRIHSKMQMIRNNNDASVSNNNR